MFQVVLRTSNSFSLYLIFTAMLIIIPIFIEVEIDTVSPF